MDTETRIELVEKFPTVECITHEELREIFETTARPKHYIGFEISGKVHLGTGLMTAMKIKQLEQAGVSTTIFLADYHAWINHKFNGDLEKIQQVAKSYFVPAMKSLGLEKTKFVLASELYENDYWKTVLRISKNTTLNRMLRCTTIMGRKSEDLSSESSLVLYPAMQCADIILLDVDIMHGGMDQRKVHMLYKDIREKLNERKRVAVHTKLLMGLQGPKRMGHEEDEALDIDISSKMSKSNPSSCIFIHDSPEEIRKKTIEAYCPLGNPENPVNQLAEVIIALKGKILIERSQKFGGDIEYTDISSLNKDFAGRKLHPLDLKNTVARELSEILKPSREYFEKRPELLTLLG